MIDPPGKQDVSNELPELRPLCRSTVVAIVGPDGTGKSTTIDEIRKQLLEKGSEVCRITRHWRPGLLPALGKLGRKGADVTQFGGPPRRHPGRFHFLRLAYYGLDFIAGHYLKDNIEKRNNRVVLYDRCALDMYVDPLRFGLKSRRGAKFLWNVVPKPDAIILLYDLPDRILARKAELSGGELQRQFAVWSELLAAEQVNAVVRINSTPAEIGRRITSYLNGNARDNGSLAQDAATQRRMLGTALQMLAGDEQGSGAKTPSAGGSSNTWATEYAVVPSLSAPRFLIPLKSRKSAANSLSVYSAHKPLARTFKWVLAKSLRTGLAQPFLRQRVFVRGEGSAAKTPGNAESLEQFLAQVLERKEVCLGVSLGMPTAHQKPLFQVMDRDGRALAYAKIGWNEETIRIVQKEAAALQKLSSCKFTSASVPRALVAENWNGYFLMLQSGPSSEGWTPSREISDSHLKFLSELNMIDHRKERLQESAWWKKIQERIMALNEMGSFYDADLVRWTLDECAVTFGETEVSFGMKHGDFAPWNLLQKGRELFVLDWEYADGHAPLGEDLFHFAIRRAALVNEARPKDIARDLLGATDVNRSIREYFAGVGIEAGLIHSFLALHVADTLSWQLCRDKGRQDSKTIHIRDIWRYLLAGYVCRGALTAA